MILFDQRQQEMLDDLEIDILNYTAMGSLSERLDDLKGEFEHFGFTLGSA